MLIAALSLLHQWEAGQIQAYCAALTHSLIQEAQTLGFVIEDEAWRSVHLFGLRVPAHLPLDRLKQELAIRRVAVSVRGDAIRISPHLYNDAADVDALREALHASLKPARVHASPS